MKSSLDSDISTLIRLLEVEFMNGEKVIIYLKDEAKENNTDIYNGQEGAVSLYISELGGNPP